ncbi:MAG: hypothetical protein Q8902_01705 [Bacteroidota bacterium]|nr:hypothetical protein [Bacteroidota bacterium]MDP4231917.1 hypothetical protein [Bacteroidota bacterium]MDP4241376.1 hypothetical protein [Bacteroidota bacterium]
MIRVARGLSLSRFFLRYGILLMMLGFIAVPVFAHPPPHSPADKSLYVIFAAPMSASLSYSTIAFTSETFVLGVYSTTQERYDTWLHAGGNFSYTEDIPNAFAKWSVSGYANGTATVGKIRPLSDPHDPDARAYYDAPENDVSPVTISVEVTGRDGLQHTASVKISVVHKSFVYLYQVGIGFKCMSINPTASADVHEIDRMEVDFNLKRNATGDGCTSEITSGPMIVKDDETGKGSCDPSIKTGITLGRTMEVTDFRCTYTGSDNLLRFRVKFHNPDCPGYKNVLLLTGGTIVDMPVKPSSNSELVPELHPKPYTEVVSPKTTTGEVLRTGWSLKEVD